MSTPAPCNVGPNGPRLAASRRPAPVATVAEALRLEISTTTSREKER